MLASTPLFFKCIEHEPVIGSYEPASALMKRTKRLAERAGMDDIDVKHLTAHGLRAGGCTDFANSGVPLDQIARQGGWSTESMLVYARPQSHHRWREARRMVAAYDEMTATIHDASASATGSKFGAGGCAANTYAYCTKTSSSWGTPALHKYPRVIKQRATARAILRVQL